MIRSISTFFLFLMLAVAVSSCAKKIRFDASPVVPAAGGTVKIKHDKNNNYAVGLKLRSLADSKDLVPPANTYVVWIETENNGIKNIGQINSSSGLLSKALKASLNAVTSFKPRSVFITAEDNADVQHPGNRTVLQTRRFSVK